VKLRDDYGVAFAGMPKDLFDLLLAKVYGPETEGNPGNSPSNPGHVDDVDAMMVYLSHAEPPIPPAKI
jgi:hypothetical protein